jgi:pimeloyl-ACP methyl ester carboxylesterase
VLACSCTSLERELSRQFLRPRHDVVARPDETGLAFDEGWFGGADGTRRHAWFIPHPESRGRTVLLCHGSAANLTFYFPYWELLHAAQLNVVVWDYAGYGRSEGDASIATLLPDARCALDWLAARPDVDARRIGVLGISLGSIVALHLAAHDPRIACAAVEDVASPRANVAVALRREHGDGIVASAFTGLAAVLALPDDCEPVANAALAVARGRPLLLLTGERENDLDRGTTLDAHAATGGGSELWVMPATGHAPHGLLQHGDAYESRLKRFFGDAFAGCFVPTDRAAEVAAARAPSRDLAARTERLRAELTTALAGEAPGRAKSAVEVMAAAERELPFPPALEAELADLFSAIGDAIGEARGADAVFTADAALAWHRRALAAVPEFPRRHFIADEVAYRSGFRHANAVARSAEVLHAAAAAHGDEEQRAFVERVLARLADAANEPPH